MTGQAVRRVAPLAAGAAVLALVAGSALLLRDDGAPPSSTDLPLLRICAGVAAADLASRDGVPGKDRVIVSATLPAGPGSARIYRFGSGQADAGRLADALGVEPGQVRTGDAVASHLGAVLRVGTAAGSPWQFARADAYVCLDPLPGEEGPDGTVSSTCAAPPPSPRPAVANPPSETEATDAARPVLDAVRLDVDEATVDPANTYVGNVDPRTVRVDPVVDDEPTTGFATSVTVDHAGVLTASGWLKEPKPSDSYPVISATDAVDRLAAMPVPLIACPESTVPVPPGPACGVPMEITGAAFGRSLQWERERAVLVPSWLFEVNGSPEPIAIVAVDPVYLADPLPSDPGDGASSGSGGGLAGSPGTVNPAPPVDPAAPAVEPTPVMSRFESVAPTDGGAALRVTFYGGVESCDTFDVVAEESPEQVSLRLVEKRIGDVCIDLAQHYERTIKLDEPLGSRRVVDGDTDSSLYPVRKDP
jgi:hypothetical protein